MIMKTLTLGFLTAAILAGGLSAPKQAHAGLALGILDENNLNYMSQGQAAAQVFMCVLLLPLCILDKDTKGVGMTAQDLIDSGFSAEKAQSYVALTGELAAGLKASHQKLSVNAGDTALSLERDSRSVLPDAPSDFVDFYTSQILAK